MRLPRLNARYYATYHRHRRSPRRSGTCFITPPRSSPARGASTSPTRSPSPPGAGFVPRKLSPSPNSNLSALLGPTLPSSQWLSPERDSLRADSVGPEATAAGRRLQEARVRYLAACRTYEAVGQLGFANREEAAGLVTEDLPVPLMTHERPRIS